MSMLLRRQQLRRFSPAVVPASLAAGVKLAVLGDSMFQYGDNWNATSSFLRNTALGEIHHALVGTSFRYAVWADAANVTGETPDRVAVYGATNRTATGDIRFSGANFGYAGDTATGCKLRVPAVINSGAKACVINAGTNVGTTDSPVGNVTAALAFIVSGLIADGVLPILGTIRPRRVVLSPVGGTYDINPAEMARILSINTWIRANAVSLGAVLWDPWNDLVDDTIPTNDPLYGNPKTGALRPDGVHYVRRGAQLGAKSLKAVLLALQPSTAPWFNPAHNVGNLLGNGNFTGTGGFAQTGVTGSVPTGWVISNTSGAGQPVTAVASVEANAETGGQTIIIDITSTGAGAHGTQEIRFAHTPAMTVSSLGLLSSDYVASHYEVEMLSGNTIVAGIESLMLNGTSTQISGTGNGFNTNRADDPLTSEPVVGWEGTHKVPVQVGGAATLNARLSIHVQTDVPGTQRIKIKRAIVRVAPNPITDFRWVP